MKKEPNKLKKLWDSKRGKALIKLVLWFFFFSIAIVVLVFQNDGQTNVSKNSVEEFIDFKVMWKNLEENNYSYEYTIKNKITNDIITYNGKIENETDIGFRESKIGIIKYKRTGKMTYQIMNSEEIETENLYEGVEENYLQLSQLKLFFNSLTLSEEQKENTKIMQYQNETETITIKMNMERIRTIEIETAEQLYTLSFYEKK